MEDTNNVVWDTLENSDQTRVLSQHAFVSAKRGNYWEDEYDGNKSLCGRIGAHDGDKFISIDEFEPQELDKEKACKICVKMYNSMISKQ